MVGTVIGEGLGTYRDLLFDRIGDGTVGFDETFFVGKREVGEILRAGVDPAVADEEAFEIPLSFRVGFSVAVKDGLRNIGNVLASVRFTSDVELGCNKHESKL